MVNQNLTSEIILCFIFLIHLQTRIFPIFLPLFHYYYYFFCAENWVRVVLVLELNL